MAEQERCPLSVDEAAEHILAAFSILPAENVPIRTAHGRVLAEDVLAPQPVPAFDNAAMDGYAVRSADTVAATALTPVRLAISAEIAAGRPAPAGFRLTPGTAARIMTGAVAPQGADAVIPFEETDETERSRQTRIGQQVGLYASVAPGKHVRRRGEDIQPGDVVVPHGTTIHSGVIAALAGIGRTRVAVTRRPRVAILATGDEVCTAGELGDLVAGQVFDANGPMLTALAEAAGAEVIDLGVACDDAQSLSLRLHAGIAAGADMIVTSGGVSKGDYDMVKEVLHAEGDMAFWQVRMRPGRPLAFGTFGNAGIPLLGLPGNPAAAFVAFLVFVRPAIERMRGVADSGGHIVPVRLVLQPGEKITNTDGRRMFVRAVVTPDAIDATLIARPVAGRGSGALAGLAHCNALLIIPEDRADVGDGDALTAILV